LYHRTTFKQELAKIDKKTIKFEGPSNGQVLDENTYKKISDLVNK